MTIGAFFRFPAGLGVPGAVGVDAVTLVCRLPEVEETATHFSDQVLVQLGDLLSPRERNSVVGVVLVEFHVQVGAS